MSNRRSSVIAILTTSLLLSGTLYTPTGFMLSSFANPVSMSSEAGYTPSDGASADGASPEPAPVQVTCEASPSSGDSPLFVQFSGAASKPDKDLSVLVYKWDFDGDGFNDFADLDSPNTTHVYVVEEQSKFEARLTVVLDDGREAYGYVTVEANPVNLKDWLEIRDLSTAKFGLHLNGTIYIYDERDWMPLNFHKDDKLLQYPSFTQIDDLTSRLTYDGNTTLLDVTLYYGVNGRARFNFTEYNAPEKEREEGEEGTSLPEGSYVGGLGFEYEEGGVATLDGSGGVWGSGGADYSP